MKLILAYIGILLIWSTTPLAIKWSSENVHFLLSASTRMGLAFLAVIPVLLWKEKYLPLNRKAMKSYASGAIGMFLAISMVYWAAQSVDSGVISVIYGFTPLLTGVQAYYILGDRFGLRQSIGVLCALSGLGVVFLFTQGSSATYSGLLVLFISVTCYGLSNVLIKYINAPVTPLQQTTGSLLFTTIGFTWLCTMAGVSLDALSDFNPAYNSRALISLLYLSLICSAVGFFLLYYVLSRLSAGAVSLITLVTPVVALVLGSQFNDEQIGWNTIAGSALIALGLIAYEWVPLKTLCTKRQV